VIQIISIILKKGSFLNSDESKLIDYPLRFVSEKRIEKIDSLSSITEQDM